MASGKDLKRRIASVKSTQQITKAMKMVAAARLRRAQEAIVRARPFAGAIKETVQNLVHNEDVRVGHALLTKREVKRVNVILMTSDRGLCGGFNSNLMKRAEAMYKSESSKYEKFTFTCFGKKGYEFLTLRKIPVAKNHTDFFKGFNYAKVNAVADEMIGSFVSGEYDEIRILFAEFRSAISQVVTTTTLLPVSIESAGATTQASGATDFLYEPNQGRVLEALLPRYFKAKFFNSFLESLASEHGARMAAMDNATKNAGELIRKLTLEYNKVRQANITRELLEIVSGAEALK
jgi:F-type H+-transporting ATPase subunit gamma